jgi:hypothetical protein
MREGVKEEEDEVLGPEVAVPDPEYRYSKE